MKKIVIILSHFILVFLLTTIGMVYMFDLTEGLIISFIGSVFGVFLYHYIHFKFSDSEKV